MNITSCGIRIFVYVIILVCGAGIAHGQGAARTFISGVGDDANPCSRTAPCKTFAVAVTKTAANGEMNCLDPGNFGAVTITKSITIDCKGIQAGALAPTVNGITIDMNIGDAVRSVRLRGISLNGFGTGINGILVIGVAPNVALQDVVIDNFTQHGISIETSIGGMMKVLMENTSIRNNTGHAINSFPIGGTSVYMAITDSTISMNGQNGLNFADNVKASVTDSVISGNATGILASNAEVYATGCTIFGNSTGVSALNGGNVRLRSNTITGNLTGVSGSTITSVTGTNSIIGNSSDGAATVHIPGN
jgi:hypothetical protein